VSRAKRRWICSYVSRKKRMADGQNKTATVVAVFCL